MLELREYQLIRNNLMGEAAEGDPGVPNCLSTALWVYIAEVYVCVYISRYKCHELYL